MMFEETTNSGERILVDALENCVLGLGFLLINSMSKHLNAPNSELSKQ